MALKRAMNLVGLFGLFLANLWDRPLIPLTLLGFNGVLN